MKKREALEFAFATIHSEHYKLFHQGITHHSDVLECDCQHGEAIRKLVRTVGKKHYSDHVSLIRSFSAPKRKRTPKAVSQPQPVGNA
jgi:hypothetical protein